MAEAAALHSSDRPEQDAAEAVAEAIESSLARTGQARLAVPGGSALAVLPSLRKRLARSWGRVALTWTDERCVPFASVDSNRGEAHRSGALDPDDPPACELPLYRDAESPADACRRVDDGLEDAFAGGLDALLLGLGEDGHVASLFPGRAPLPGRVAYLRDSPKPPAERITLTLPFLATASRVVVYACGEGKRDAVRRLLAGDSALPASHLDHLLLVSDLEMDANE